MFSCRPNPVIKFYLNKNHSCQSHQPTKEAATNINKINPQEMLIFADYLEDHRKKVMMDFQKKLEESKTLKKRFSIQSSQRNSVYYMRVKTSREPSSKQKQKSETKKRFFRSVDLGQDSLESSVRVNTINFNVNGIHAYDTGGRKQSFSKEAVTNFQKTTLKRLRAKESIIIKKKLISHEIDQRHHEQVQKLHDKPCEVKSFRVFTETHL